MADNPSNFDISQYYPDDTQDPFDGINFTTDIDPNFEVRLGNDVVSPSIPDIPVSASPGEESSALIASMPSHEPDFEMVSQQPQFVNPHEIYTNLQPVNELYLQQPQLTGEQFSYSNEAYPEQPLLVNSQQTYIAPQPPYAPYNPAHVNNTNTDWPLAQQQTLNNMLIQDPVFDAPPLGSHQVYTQYPIPDSRTNNQIMMHQQPMHPDYQVAWPAQEPLITHVPEGPQPMPLPAPQLVPQPAPQLALPALSKPVSPVPVPKGPLPQGEFKPIDPNADSYLPRMREGRYSKRLPTAGTLTTCPPIKRVARTDNGELLLNEMIPRKTHGNKGPSHVEPERYYGPSPTRPEDWGPKDKRGKYLFTYTAKGELAAGLFLSARNMRRYLLGPSREDVFKGPSRLPGVKTKTKKMRQGLTLWLGWPAAMANSRYPRGGESTKCRFKNCPHTQRTISLGEPWVIFDERQNETGEYIDPFHNAGYVHLSCLEHHFDIIDLWHYLDIRLDHRSFKRETHPYFSIGYKLPGIDWVVNEWWVARYEEWDVAMSHGLKRVRTHDSSLAETLVIYKLRHEPKGQAKNREKRKGADMSKHRGNPELKRAFQEFKKHGLLDEQGWPLRNADVLLAEIQNPTTTKKWTKATRNQSPAALPPPPPMQYMAVQAGPQVQQFGAGPVNTMQPMYPTADLTHLNHTVAPGPYMPPVPGVPQVAGVKRDRDVVVNEDDNIGHVLNQAAGNSPTINQETPSPKRLRLDDTAAAHYPTDTLPTPAQTIVGTAEGQVQSGPPDSPVDDNTGVPAGLPAQSLSPAADSGWHTPIDYDVDMDSCGVDAALDNHALDAFYGTQGEGEPTTDNGEPVGDADGHVDDELRAEPIKTGPIGVEQLPTPPHEAEGRHSDSEGDSGDSLFGKPGQEERS